MEVSGSDSCEPLEGANLGPGPGLSVEEADSLVGPGDGPAVVGPAVDGPAVFGPAKGMGVAQGVVFKQSSGDMGGGASGEELSPRKRVVKKVESKEQLAKAKGKGSFGGMSGNVGTKERARTSSLSVSVPPGFQMIDKGKEKASAGAASPFGKWQRGGFRFLKRPASNTASSKSKGSVGKKSKVPLSRVPNEVFNEVALNVGVKLPLNEEQIAFLKSLEEDRAST